MKRPEELSHMLTEMYNDTKDGKIHWNISVQTTENNEVSEKPVEVEDGVSWTIDECYVSYYCKYKGQDFLMITYEMIKTAGDKVHTTNMIFLPPLGIRVFQLPMLLPYAVQASGVLANQIHNLWELLLAMKKADPESVFMEVSAGKLVIEDEKFAGAEDTYTIEALMHDGKALQSGTSHNFGDGFAKAFGIQYTDKQNKLQYVHQTSWGMTTRLIGAIIMVHGDNDGLVLPPKVAPTQVMVIPIQMQKDGVLDKANEVRERLGKVCRAKLDDSDKSPGWKFSEQEMRGIPLRVELGPKDIAANKCVVVRRDTREKIEVSLDEIETKIPELLETVQKDMFARAKAHRDAHIWDAHNYEEFKDIAENKPGFIRGMWCGDQACEDKIKEDLAVTSRCMPFNDQEQISDVCVCCGKPAHKLVYWGKAY